jgi:pimeloyl-ACP methyl ester carboxylesterase
MTTSILRIYEQVGHNPHWEQPDRFVADLEQFLAAMAR